MKKTEQHNNFPKVMVIIALMLIILTVTNVHAQASGIPVGSIAYVNVSDFLNLRREPQGEIIGQIARGEKVTILSGPDRNNYYQICVNKTGEVCYAYGEYLVGTQIQSSPIEATGNSNNVSNKKPTMQGTGVYMTVNSDYKLNMRVGPNRSERRVRYLANGEIVEVLDETIKNNYIKVRAESDGKIGYVDLNYLVSSDSDTLNNEQNNCVCQCECCK